MSRYDMTDKKGFLLNAKGCELLYSELEKLEKRLSRKVQKQTDKWNEQIAHIMTYTNEEEIRDEYGYGCITEAQCRKYIELFQKGKELQDEPVETPESVALSILHMMMGDVRREGWQHRFDALSPEEQLAELQRAEEQRHKLRRHKHEVQKIFGSQINN